MKLSLGKESQTQTETFDPNWWGCPENTQCTWGLKTLVQLARDPSSCLDSTVEFAGRSPTASVGAKLQLWLWVLEQEVCLVFGTIPFGVDCPLRTGQRNRLLPSDLPVEQGTAPWLMGVPPSPSTLDAPAKGIYQISYCRPLTLFSPLLARVAERLTLPYCAIRL